MPAPAELLRIRDERIARRPELAHLRERTEPPKSPRACKKPTELSRNRQENPTASTPAIAERDGDTLRLVLHLPPRTKKNGTTLGIRQSAGYRRYRDRVIAMLAPIVPVLRLPLPDQGYNIAAVYYVDRRGEPADKVGLDQGLYDALENAGVVTDDWFFRTADGTRIVAGDPDPRVELVITPLPPPLPLP